MYENMAMIKHRAVCLIGAVIVALAMIVGSVFAWRDNSQHKSNIMTGGNGIVRDDVVLVEDFEEHDDWMAGEQIKKRVSVKNTGDGEVYIRLQLKEYMDIATVDYVYTQELLLVDSMGDFVAGESPEQLKSWLDSHNVIYREEQIVKYKAYGQADEGYYLSTDDTTNINGKYGRKMLLDYTQGEPVSLVEGVERGSYQETDDHKLHPTPECRYTLHLWDDAAYDPFHEYVEWALDTNIIKMSNWDGQPIAAWIVDDTSEQGFVYWGEAIKAGQSTTDLIHSMTLIKQPEGPFYYALHIDMQATDIYNLDLEFSQMPLKLSQNYHSGSSKSLDN